MTKIYDKTNYKEALQAIKRGALTVYPTETVYGIGSVIHNSISLAKIFVLKKRPRSKPLSLNIASAEMARPFLNFSDYQRYQKIAAKFLPGPLSVIFKTSIESEAAQYFTRKGSISLRMPASGLFLDALRAVGPIAGTSANLSGELSLTDPHDVKAAMKDLAEIILLDGAPEIGVESTILDLTGNPKIFRVGAISVEEISDFLAEPVEIVTDSRRYELRKTLYLYRNSAELNSLIDRVKPDDYLIWGNNFGFAGKYLPQSPLAELFSTLKKIDQDSKISVIFAEETNDDLYNRKLGELAQKWE
ncbi:L-threonylcarbamoyladenylate synthase [Xylocopilactobacillus apicola]|uniref:Threonylcarbamoyl-AMP synthase n=1 Tax=Xylocopilactobacillus apicola TaxID=2932184 RepID=A0AAU9D0P7_9LACO|nr:L-threonylcarbamoyladenylate synthase [Xylocopilactobacillus apicola]BDR58266.1 threonylcarbamoyl-AMP synthase [Xylocopilactobacillus apicola]